LIPEPPKYGTFLRVIGLAFILALGLDSSAQPGRISPDTLTDYCRIDSIVLSGNKITRPKIMLREIIFTAGDRVPREELDSLISLSRQNLLNTLLFNFVDIRKSFTSPDSADAVIRVSVIERWYVWPVPILLISDRNFNVWWKTKDLSRLSYGFYIDWRNFRGRKESLVLRFQWGYNRNVGFQYTIPYINRAKTLGMGFGMGYSRQKETAYQTTYNKQDFFKEQYGFAREDYYAYGQLLVRRDIYNTHMLELSYDQHEFSDSLLIENPHYTSDGATKSQYLSFYYTFKSDHRDYKSYPLKGYYLDFAIVKHGLWTFKNNTLNTFQVEATFRKFWELNPRLYFASGLNGKITAGKEPYFIMQGIGFDRDVVRSYEYYLVDAQHFFILKNNIKFVLIPTTVKDISFIKSQKFGKIFYALYMNVFIDTGYGFYNQDFGRATNDLQNTLLLGYGTGLDFVSYYDIVIGLDFSVNFKNETGIFLHFMAPI
jgi:hypothetical protein